MHLSMAFDFIGGVLGGGKWLVHWFSGLLLLSAPGNVEQVLCVKLLGFCQFDMTQMRMKGAVMFVRYEVLNMASIVIMSCQEGCEFCLCCAITSVGIVSRFGLLTGDQGTWVIAVTFCHGWRFEIKMLLISNGRSHQR